MSILKISSIFLYKNDHRFVQNRCCAVVERVVVYGDWDKAQMVIKIVAAGVDNYKKEFSLRHILD